MIYICNFYDLNFFIVNLNFKTGMTAKRSKLYDVKVERAGLHDYRLTSDILRTNFKPAIQVDFSHHVFEHLEVIIRYELRVKELEML